MIHQNVVLGVWLGMAVLAFICAGARLWRFRRLLNRLRQGVHVSQGRVTPSALADETSLVHAP